MPGLGAIVGIESQSKGRSQRPHRPTLTTPIGGHLPAAEPDCLLAAPKPPLGTRAASAHTARAESRGKREAQLSPIVVRPHRCDHIEPPRHDRHRTSIRGYSTAPRRRPIARPSSAPQPARTPATRSTSAPPFLSAHATPALAAPAVRRIPVPLRLGRQRLALLPSRVGH